MAGRYDIIIEQGATFLLPMTIKNSNGTLFDLTGYTAKGCIKRNRRSQVIVASFSFTYDVDRTLGKMEASLDDETTEAIPAGETTTDPRSKYVYDIAIENETIDQAKRLLEGFAYISPEVTRLS
jgi:hypothetical protein